MVRKRKSTRGIREELHGPCGGGHAAVDPQHGILRAGPVLLHGLQQAACLVADALQRGAGEFLRFGVASQADERRHQVDMVTTVGSIGVFVGFRR